MVLPTIIIRVTDRVRVRVRVTDRVRVRVTDKVRVRGLTDSCLSCAMSISLSASYLAFKIQDSRFKIQDFCLIPRILIQTKRLMCRCKEEGRL